MPNNRPPVINVEYYAIPQKITPAKKKKKNKPQVKMCPCPHHHPQGTAEKAALVLSKKLIQGGKSSLVLTMGLHIY